MTSSTGRTVLTLEAVDSSIQPIHVIPMQVRRDGATFELTATVDLTSAFRGMAEATRSLRLRLAWENSTLSPPTR